MIDSRALRTTATQAFADTIIDESHSRKQGLTPTPAPAGNEPLPGVGDVVANHYKLKRLLGEGMFGRVFVAQRVDVPEHQVALKIMAKEVYSGRNVDRELVMLAAANHPNVVQLKDHGVTSRYVWLTMPVYEGETLAQRLKRGTLSLREAYEIFVPIARGVEALHRAGLRHQDLKPENVFLAQFAGRLHPTILDLGVAAECSASFVAGTLLFAAPEQVAALTSKGLQPILSEKMDTYALAATLLLALVGPEDFPGDAVHSRDDLREAHEERANAPLRKDAIPDLTGVPRKALEQALQRWMSIDQDERPSIAEMAEDLDVLLEQEREEARAHERRLGRQRALLRTFRFIVALLLLAALGLMAFGWSKRETLRLAGELNRVRAEGAASFDKLETCAASHKLAIAELNGCKEVRTRDRDDFKRSLEELSSTGSNAQAECAKQVMTYTTRLKVCEDGAAAQEKALIAQRDGMMAECTQKESALVAERDDARRLAEARATELTEANSALQQCKAGRPAPRANTKKEDDPYADPPSSSTPPAASAPAAASAAPPPPLPPPQQQQPPAQQLPPSDLPKPSSSK